MSKWPSGHGAATIRAAWCRSPRATARPSCSTGVCGMPPTTKVRERRDPPCCCNTPVPKRRFASRTSTGGNGPSRSTRHPGLPASSSVDVPWRIRIASFRLLRSLTDAPAISSRVHALQLPLERDPERGFKPHPLFRGSTPNLRSIGCHVSVLDPGKAAASAASARRGGNPDCPRWRGGSRAGRPGHAGHDETASGKGGDVRVLPGRVPAHDPQSFQHAR